MSRLIELNALTPGDNGVYSNPDSAERDFAYSDGSGAERYLRDVFAGAADLSSTSAELQAHIRDWPSEYHLSPRRANLLRPLDLRAGMRILELGCGCGAITRFLGETGCRVDAIEGSAIRADLARLRCRGLDGVDIVQANFNRLELPDAEYDAVLLVGVAEYARRFSPASDDDRGAVVDLLKRATAALKPDGRVLVAIENRTGMKYLHGAHEDHYSLRFVGIDGYRESAGIRTYTRREWRAIAADCGLSTTSFLYPFPDYKKPVAILGERFVDECPDAWCQLEGIDSDDYTFLFDPYVPESIAWQGYNAAGVLGDMANSFLLSLSRDAPFTDFEDLDFTHLPDFRRRREHCRVITRRRGEDRVRREPLPGNAGDTTHEPFFRGTLLSSLWARAVMIGPEGAFRERMREYRAFLDGRRADAGALPIDLLPNNIVVADDGAWQVFDQEWRDDAVEVDYLLFRAVLTFASLERPALRQYARRHDLHDVRGFVDHAMRAAGCAVADIDAFARREDAFQERVLLAREAATADVLDTVIDDNPVCAWFHPRLYWSADDSGFDDARSVGARLAPAAGPVDLVLDLPPDVRRIARLRFDPCDQHRPHDAGFLNVDAISIFETGDDSRHVLWSLDGEDIVLARSRIDQLTPIEVGDERVLAVTGDDPHLVLEPGVEHTGESPLSVAITLRLTASREYRLARRHCLNRDAMLIGRIQALEERLREAKRDGEELVRIKTSRTWRVLSALRRRITRRATGLR